jgi:predicted nucleic acid-binding protein
MVVDASVWVSSLMPQDVHHQASRAWLDQYLSDGRIMVAPVLLLSEVAGAVARLKGDSQSGRQAFRDLLDVPRLRLVDHDAGFGRAAAELAADLRLRGADAIYVAAARLLHIPLVTWDREQQQRAGAVIAVRTPR